MRFSIGILAGLAVDAIAAPASISSANLGIVHERLERGTWTKLDALPAKDVLPVRISLKQRNLDKGMDYLLGVSDPESPSYGKHYTSEQVVELFAPSDESIRTVKQWLVASGIKSSAISIPKSRGWIGFDSTAEQLESLLQTKFHTFLHGRSNTEYIGTHEYTLPEHVSDLVDFVSPGVMFTRRMGQSAASKNFPNPVRPTHPHKPDVRILNAFKSDKNSTENCGSIITPQCIRKMYNIPLPKGSVNPKNRLGIYESAGETYAQKDLNDFFTLAAPQIPNGTHPLNYLIGPTTASGPVSSAGGEADLDFQIAYPIVYPQGIVDYAVYLNESSTTGYTDLFDTFLDAIDASFCNYTVYGQTGDDPAVDGDTTGRKCGEFKPTNVISISYGLAEQEYPVNYQKRQCDEYMKLGLQGVTLLLASGDAGVAEDVCQGPKENIFVVDSASACPYMTAVGSTTLPMGSKPGDPETATTSFASGGGFSNIYPRPKYQNLAVASFFKNHDPGFKNYTTSNGTLPSNGGVYNGAGRGYPDLSAVGDNGLTVVAGYVGLEGGTSMSAPLIGGIINRINEDRLRLGKSSVGFINPVIYKNTQAFNDIVKGDQSSNGYCLGKGFKAVKGWDPVTGLGTPDYPKLLEVFLKLK